MNGPTINLGLMCVKLHRGEQETVLTASFIHMPSCGIRYADQRDQNREFSQTCMLPPVWELILMNCIVALQLVLKVQGYVS